ncbi:hypothetical protein ACLOJK_037569 [Asimina triloba]
MLVKKVKTTLIVHDIEWYILRNPNLRLHNEEARIRRFQNGLDDNIRDMVMAKPSEMCGKAMDQAMWVEKAVAQFGGIFVKRKGEVVERESSSKK